MNSSNIKRENTNHRHRQVEMWIGDSDRPQALNNAEHIYQMRHHGNHLRHNANGNNGLYRRGDSVCSTDSGVSMMTMEGMHHVGPEYYAMMNHGNQYRNLEVVGTVKRCLSNKGLLLFYVYCLMSNFTRFTYTFSLIFNQSFIHDFI